MYVWPLRRIINFKWPGLSKTGTIEAMHIDTHPAAKWMHNAASAGRAASQILAVIPDAVRNDGLRRAAAALRLDATTILAANAADLEASTGSPAFLDRLMLNPARLETIAAGIEAVADLPDPLSRTLADWVRPNGLRIQRVAMPIGVIGMVYESRPNVGADAASLCVKSGNAVILRAGSESMRSAYALHAAIMRGFREAGLPDLCVQMVPNADRGYVSAMLGSSGQIDMIIPRGGKSLVRRVQRDARVPVLAHADGLCHTYVHESADAAMALRVVANAKMRRVSVCGATETLLIDAAIAPSLLPDLIASLAALECTFRADARARAIVPSLPAADAEDFDTEWLDSVLSVVVVDNVDAAIAHIRLHGSSHTDAILTEDEAVAQKFLRQVDSAVVMWNASTQFCDGGEFGFGAEIGIATSRLHARGPVGLEQLTTYRYIVTGTGQIRD